MARVKSILGVALAGLVIAFVLMLSEDPFRTCIADSPGGDGDIAACADKVQVPCEETDGTRIEGKRENC